MDCLLKVGWDNLISFFLILFADRPESNTNKSMHSEGTVKSENQILAKFRFGIDANSNEY